jgi:hypothetical protein
MRTKLVVQMLSVPLRRSKSHTLDKRNKNLHGCWLRSSGTCNCASCSDLDRAFKLRDERWLRNGNRKFKVVYLSKSSHPQFNSGDTPSKFFRALSAGQRTTQFRCFSARGSILAD